MDIYIKPKKKISLSGAGHVTVGHVCQVQAPAEIKSRVENLELVPVDGRCKILNISVIDIIAVIDLSMPGNSINNVGETDTVVMYSAVEKRDVPLFKWIKVSIISLIFAIGAATAIMSFHNDAEIPKVFQAYHRIFTGDETGKPRVLQITYAIGIAGGIIVFFNHFAGKKITADPSPIEIEMSDYDKTVTETLVSLISSEEEAKKNGG